MEAVFYNGKIFTMDDDMHVGEALAVSGGRVAAVGGSGEILALSGPMTLKVDLGGRTVIPGLVDAHAHFHSYAIGRARLDLVGTESLDEILDLVARKAGETGEGGWIAGRGWDQNDWDDKRFPHKRSLDAVAPRNPVYLSRVCGHAAYVNSEALRAAGISSGTPDPPGGRILRDVNGEPTGVLVDEAMELVYELIPPPTRAEKKKLIVEAAHECLAAGLVGVHEMGVTTEIVSIYKELFEEEVLPFRLTTYYSRNAEDLDSVLEAGLLTGYAGEHLSVVGVKFFIDGSLGARSAALLSDYSDDPGNKGILVMEPGELYAGILSCHRKGFQAATHAIGDRGNRLVLDVLEKIQGEHPIPDTRHRIEHAQVVSPEDIPRFAALGVIPSMQFTHCTSDMPWAGDRLGPDRLAGAYAWRSFLSSGCRIPGGSDFPVESIDPMLGIYAAVTRMDLEGNPEGGWLPSERLTVEEAVRAFTVDAAYAVHQEELRGSLTAGKLADFIVLSDDIMSVAYEVIPDIRILATVLGGEIVYRAEDFPVGKGD